MGVSLVILVGLFRTFLAGGYMIETGSMAPCLMGDHRQVVCPACRYSFAVEGVAKSIKAVCPNCGQNHIAVEKFPRNEGDHLLVHRALFEFRRPRRWEVVVFRNPNKPTQAYVKRLVALPGESLQIIDGDIYIGGTLRAKGYATQRGIGIPVYDHDFRPSNNEPDWQPRWVIESQEAGQPESGWKETGGKFRFSTKKQDHASELAWVYYRNWVRRGGMHTTKVQLTHWPESLERPQSGFGCITFEEDAQTLVCRGALPFEQRNQLLAATRDPDFRGAIQRLYEESHVAPVTDGYGYNRGHDGQGRHEVRDLMFTANVSLHDGPGTFVVAITDGTEEFHCLFDLAQKQVRLIHTRTGRAMRTAPLSDELLHGPVRVDVSLMDRQVLLAVGGKLAFKPLSYGAPVERGPTPRRPVRFGAAGTEVEVSSLRLFRDVYYSDDIGHHAIEAPVQLQSNQYFVLGDNSPVSKDSRSWSSTTVLTDDMFLGKPLAVHLPSRNRRIRVGNWQTEIRIPEFSRMRYIH